MQIIIRCDVGQDIGLGHYMRCSTIKNALKKYTPNVCLAIKNYGDNKNDLDCDFLIEGEYQQEVAGYQASKNIFVIDLLHKKNINSSDFKDYICSLKKNGNIIILIEGLEDDACPHELYPAIDTLCTPYAGVFKEKIANKHIYGKEYLLLDFRRILTKKNISEVATKILITFGGSDPYNQTSDFLNFIHTIEQVKKLEFEVVAGPLMSNSQINQIKSFQKSLNLDIIFSPKNLKECFECADLAITNTGQTRYELAASGVPFLIVPFDVSGLKNSIIFEQKGAAVILNELKTKAKDVVINVLANFQLRQNMSQSGRENFYTENSADNFARKVLKYVE